jgi:hypothetical protein
MPFPPPPPIIEAMSIISPAQSAITIRPIFDSPAEGKTENAFSPFILSLTESGKAFTFFHHLMEAFNGTH